MGPKEVTFTKRYRNETLSNESIFPSYTRLICPYSVLCRIRYARSGQRQKKQFIGEHSRIEMMQIRALDGVRIHREFCDNVLVPIAEENLITLTRKEQRRLEYILDHPIK